MLTTPQSDVLLYFLALFLPPVSVFMKRGCGADFVINIGLSILGWIPGVIRTYMALPTALGTFGVLTEMQMRGGSFQNMSGPLDTKESRRDERRQFTISTGGGTMAWMGGGWSIPFS